MKEGERVRVLRRSCRNINFMHGYVCSHRLQYDNLNEIFFNDRHWRNKTKKKNNVLTTKLYKNQEKKLLKNKNIMCLIEQVQYSVDVNR